MVPVCITSLSLSLSSIISLRFNVSVLFSLPHRTTIHTGNRDTPVFVPCNFPQSNRFQSLKLVNQIASLISPLAFHKFSFISFITSPRLYFITNYINQKLTIFTSSPKLAPPRVRPSMIIRDVPRGRPQFWLNSGFIIFLNWPRIHYVWLRYFQSWFPL